MKLAIASGKGGTGKTTLSVNLAAWMAEKTPTLLVDLDVEEPDSGLFIRGALCHSEPRYKLVPEWQAGRCDHCGRCQEVCSFNAVLALGDQVLVLPALCHGCFACSGLCPSGALPMRPVQMGELKHFRAGSFDHVESRLLVGEVQAVPLIRQTIEWTDKQFPATTLKIYDAPPGTSCPMTEVARAADLVILVTEPTPFGMHDLSLAVNTVRQLEKDCLVVLNRDGAGDDRVDTYCRTEGIEIVARIPQSQRIAERTSRGQLLVDDFPVVSRAIGTIADRILSHSRDVPA